MTDLRSTEYIIPDLNKVRWVVKGVEGACGDMIEYSKTCV